MWLVTSPRHQRLNSTMGLGGGDNPEENFTVGIGAPDSRGRFSYFFIKSSTAADIPMTPVRMVGEGTGAKSAE